MTVTDPFGAPAGPQLTSPTPALVTMLQSVQGYPAVSLLLTTTPARRMRPEDAARLTGLLRDAEHRLAQESLPGVTGTVLEPLADLVARATDGPTSAAVAVYASAAVRAVLHLPVEVTDRVVVDPTFATRDLVRALHRTPRHLVLALSLHEARLFDGVGDDLRPAPVRSFPRTVRGGPRQDADPQRGADSERGADPQRGADRTSKGDPLAVDPAEAAPITVPGGPAPRRLVRPGERRVFYREVDRALGAYLRVNPAPLVLVGTERVLAEFRRVSTNLGRLAGCVRGSLVTAPTSELTPRIRTVLHEYLRSREREAIELLERRAGAGRVVDGIHACWLAARAERPEMLAVEEGYVFPARLDAEGDLLTEATDVEHPDVVDDVVDELIEAVLRRGGWVALLADGALADRGRVALTLCR